MSEKSKNKRHEVVKYHNDLSEVSFRNFKSSDLDLFMSICMKCLDQGTREVIITDSELAELAHYGKDLKRMGKDFENLKKKILALQLKHEDEDTETDMVLFPVFQRNKKTKENRIKINEEFDYILNKLSGEFTEFELEEFVMLRSTYSRLAYRQLKRYKDTGWWKVSIEKFRELMDIPKNYRMDNINQRVLAPIQEELEEYFEDLKIEKIPEVVPGKRGRPAIVGISFTFKPVEEKKKRNIKKIGYPCPYCGKDLYEIERKDGKGVFIGHKDGKNKNAKCRRTFSTIAEVRGLKEIPNREQKEDPIAVENEDRGGEMSPEETRNAANEARRRMGVMTEKMNINK